MNEEFKLFWKCINNVRGGIRVDVNEELKLL